MSRSQFTLGSTDRLDVADDLIRSGTATGIVVAAARGQLTKHYCLGHDRPSEDDGALPLSGELLFNVGSVTKCIIGTLLADVVAEGLISLDDPVQRYLERYSDRTDTIRQLATHTAGYAFSQMETWPQRYDELEEFRSRVYRPREKRNRPVRDMEYWSTGYFVLMELLESVLSDPIESIANERLFRPLNMGRTTFDSARASEMGRVFPYDAANGRRLTELGDAPPQGETGLWTCAQDLLTLGRAFLDEGDLPRRTVNLLTQDQSRSGWRRTLGFWLPALGGPECPFAAEMSTRSIGHPGYTGCYLGVDPENHFCIAVTSPSLRLHSDFCNYAKLTSAMWNKVATSD